MDFLSAIVRFFQQGGIFMYPILIVFGLGLAIAVERWAYLTVSGASNRALWKKIVPFLKSGNFQEAAATTGKSKAAIAGQDLIIEAGRVDSFEPGSVSAFVRGMVWGKKYFACHEILY